MGGLRLTENPVVGMVSGNSKYFYLGYQNLHSIKIQIVFIAVLSTYEIIQIDKWPCCKYLNITADWIEAAHRPYLCLLLSFTTLMKWVCVMLDV
jgi:hypothetical protein